mgnify:CR=1 FL=1
MRRRAAIAAALSIAATLSLAGAQPLHAAEIVVARVESEAAIFRVVRLLADLDHPWSMSWLPEGEALIALRPGELLRWRPGDAEAKRIDGVPSVANYGQGGLFDVKPAPDFADTGRVVLAYAAAGEGGAATRIAEARLAGDRLVGLRILFDGMPRTRAGQHFGGRLRFDADGALYATFGDRGDRDRAQDPDDPAGSVYRIPPGGKPERITMGNRNPQGLAVHPETGALWMHEHGPRGGDEVNIVKPGANYGWPIVTYGREYSGGEIAESGTAPGFEPPLHVWVPSIAPSGMAFYEGDAFPGWRDSLFVGALKDRLLARLTVTGDAVTGEERLLEGRLGRIREVSVGPDGSVYVLTDAEDGSLFRLEPL